MEAELWSNRAQSRKGPRQRTWGVLQRGRHDRALMRYPVLVQTRMGNPDHLVLPEGYGGASRPRVTSA